MKISKIIILLTTVNFLLLLFLFNETGTATVQEEMILRGEGMELTDMNGKVRTKITFEKDGEAVLRLFDGNGNIRVKIGASAKGSGIVLLNDSTEFGVQILAEDTGTIIKLADTDGKEKIIKP